MLDLSLPREPYWIEVLPGIEFQVSPVTSVMMLAARNELASENAEEGYGNMIFALARAAIRDWRGITLAGETAPVTPENITAVMQVWAIFRAFEDKYYSSVLKLDEEKNALAPV